MKQHYQGMLETERRHHETVQYGRYLKVHTGKLEMKYNKNASLFQHRLHRHELSLGGRDGGLQG